MKFGLNGGLGRPRPGVPWREAFQDTLERAKAMPRWGMKSCNGEEEPQEGDASTDRSGLGHERDLPPEDQISGSFEDILRGRFIVGSPDDCAQEIQRYKDLGVEMINMHMQWEGMSPEQGWNSMRLMAEEVLPHPR